LGEIPRGKTIPRRKKLVLLYQQQRKKEADGRKDSWSLRRSHVDDG